MNLDELLAFKPKKVELHETEDDLVENAPALKRVRKETTPSAPNEENGLTDEEKLKLLQTVAEDEDLGEALDSGGVKRMLLNFEKKVLRNQEMRIKFPDLPEKFMESEIELNEEVQKLHVIATVPEHYAILSELNVVETLVGLLSHDNSDIAIAVIDLLQEMTDVDALNDSEEEAMGLMDALLNQQLIAVLVQNLERLDEKVREESDGVHNALAIIENMTEFKSAEVCSCAGEQGLLPWLLKRIRLRPYDANKLYATEILAILLQGNETNQRLLGEKEGIDVLLQALAYYKRREPGSLDEVEMLENLFDCLCSALMFTPNRERFLKGEGLQLMILMLREKSQSHRSALKVLNHAMCGAEGVENCTKFVEVYGLRSLFPLFMKNPKRSRKGVGGSPQEYEEHVCAIMASLFRNVEGNGRERLIGKFVENDHEKVDRLMELHFHYLQKLRNEDCLFPKGVPPSEDDPPGGAAVENYMQRLEAGLFVLQLVDYVILELCLCRNPTIHARVMTLLNQHGDSLHTIKRVVGEYVENMEEGGGEAVGTEKRRLMAMVDELAV